MSLNNYKQPGLLTSRAPQRLVIGGRINIPRHNIQSRNIHTFAQQDIAESSQASSQQNVTEVTDKSQSSKQEISQKSDDSSSQQVNIPAEQVVNSASVVEDASEQQKASANRRRFNREKLRESILNGGDSSQGNVVGPGDIPVNEENMIEVDGVGVIQAEPVPPEPPVPAKPKKDLLEVLLKDTYAGLEKFYDEGQGDEKIPWQKRLEVNILVNPEIEAMKEAVAKKDEDEVKMKLLTLNKLEGILSNSQITLLKGLYWWRLGIRAEAQWAFERVLKKPKNEVPEKERIAAHFNLMAVWASWGDYTNSRTQLLELIEYGIDIERYMKKPRPGMVLWSSPKQVQVALVNKYRRELKKRRKVRRVLVSSPDQKVSLLGKPLGAALGDIQKVLANPDADFATMIDIDMPEGSDRTLFGIVKRVSYIAIGSVIVWNIFFAYIFPVVFEYLYLDLDW